MADSCCTVETNTTLKKNYTFFFLKGDIPSIRELRDGVGGTESRWDESKT